MTRMMVFVSGAGWCDCTMNGYWRTVHITLHSLDQAERAVIAMRGCGYEASYCVTICPRGGLYQVSGKKRM